ncbi:murein biosynthesis integral membrane protein MurJ [Acidicapsa ligni]|uniref:murein biosynthesis integral membrane protein MurJ n=1 Tax=Acidicapsa ligni TaxID=542300 RepID=UPI0021DFBB88|nr:murein biosynthesis integral membrane protein MurJ [Acidicapsa ligni]
MSNLPPASQQDKIGSPAVGPRPSPPSRLARVLGMLRPSHSHTAYTATVLLMVSAVLSRLMGLVRVKYFALLFGRDMQADALNAAFVLPDMISYFLVGGAASITFVTILTRYRDTGREAQGERSLSVILTTMVLVLTGAILIAELLAPWFIRAWFPGFDEVKAALCVSLTRILLPAQLCFFAGGVFGAVLLVRKQFSIQAVTPLIYNLGTIVGGVLLYKKIGVSSVAIGTVAGAFVGPFLLNAIGAWRVGTRYRPLLDWQDEGFREWVRLSIPLMVGISLVTADNWIIAHFASKTDGAVSVMNYAKQLFTAPMAVLAQAAGAASMPFFARLWAQEKRYEFATEVADSVSRVAAMGILAASGMIALAPALVDLVLRGGKFDSAASSQTAVFFAVFSISLFLWSAQAIYARAFYAAGNTLVPMVAGTIVTLVSLPIYASFYHFHGAMGLAIASDLGIALQTASLAVLLHQRRMVSLASIDVRELGRCVVAGAIGGAVVWLAVTAAGRVVPGHNRWIDLAELIVGGAIWLAVAGGLLDRLGSALPRMALTRLGLVRRAG